MCKLNILAYFLAIFAVLLAGCTSDTSIPKPLPASDFKFQMTGEALNLAGIKAKNLICVDHKKLGYRKKPDFCGAAVD